MPLLALAPLLAVLTSLTACATSISDLSAGPVRVRTEPALQHRPERLVVAVTLKTSRDLNTVQEPELLHAETFFCDRPRDFVLLGREISSPTNDRPDASGLYTYVVLLNASRTASPSSNPPQIGFDLAAHPRSVCIRLKGGGYFAPGVSSNMVTVSETDIREAFERYRKPDG